MKILFAIFFTVLMTGVFAQQNLSSDLDLITVNARVEQKAGGRALAGVRGYLSVPGRHFIFSSAVSDQDGTLSFIIKKPSAPVEWVVSTDDFKGEAVLKDGNWKMFPVKPTGNNFVPFPDTTLFYGHPDKTYNLDDYTRFGSIEEIMVEYVREVRLRKQGGRFQFEVLNTPYEYFFNEPALVLLDGVKVNDMERLLAVDPLRLKRLDVVARRYYAGSLACNGIVSFISYDGDMGGMALPPGSIVVEYK